MEGSSKRTNLISLHPAGSAASTWRQGKQETSVTNLSCSLLWVAAHGPCWGWGLSLDGPLGSFWPELSVPRGRAGSVSSAWQPRHVQAQGHKALGHGRAALICSCCWQPWMFPSRVAAVKKGFEIMRWWELPGTDTKDSPRCGHLSATSLCPAEHRLGW